EIIIDKEARDAWVAALPTAKQVVIMEETFTTEANRLVANAKYDYVRGYITKGTMVSRLQLLDLPDSAIEFHVMDADEDRTRKRNDDRLVVIKDMWMKDVEPDFMVISAWAMDIIVDEEALNLWLDDTYFDKMKGVRIPEVPPKPPAVTVATLRTGFRAGILSASELAAELTKRGYSAGDIELMIAVELSKVKPETYPVMPLGTLKKAFREQIITEERFRDELEARRYTPDDIATMVAVEVKALMEELAVMPAQIKVVSLG
ncbi:unnamed protein product, partial [marine sediment metagenome]